jgi:hypothetical protein
MLHLLASWVSIGISERMCNLWYQFSLTRTEGVLIVPSELRANIV